MAKNIRWQIPFVSTIDKTKYRVDIYDEGTFTPVELTAGPTPFVTNEDASDDFFHPIRTQTGTLQVCTQLPSGGMITLNDLLPENNISRPVRLVSIATNNTETIEWQGFLSCEAYNQDYIGIPQILDIPVISVLEAMDSVQLDQSRSSGLVLVRAALKTAIDEMMLQSGMNFYDYVNYSQTSYHILNKYIDQTVLFELKEYNNENSTTYIVSGLSVKNAIERIAQYMGWVVRENGTTIYFIRLGDDIYTSYVVYENFGNSSAFSQREDYVTNNLATDVAYRGTGHQRSIAAGAKSVEVIAKLEKYDIKVDKPAFPYIDLTTYEITTNQLKNLGQGGGSIIYNNTHLNSTVSSNITFSSKCTFRMKELNTTDGTVVQDTTFANVISYACINPNNIIPSWVYDHAKYVGAFMAKIKKNDDDYLEGIYITGDQQGGAPTNEQNFLFELRSVMRFRASKGILKIGSKVSYFIIGDAEGWDDDDDLALNLCLKFGDKYWNGTQWVDIFSRCNIRDGMEIPCIENMEGEIIIRIYSTSPISGSMPPDMQYFGKDTFISKLTIDYETEELDNLYDRSANHYFRLLGTNFRDEISVSTEIASNLNNQPCPSLIMDDITTPMTVMDYVVSGGTEQRRPEVDLLDRLAIYYGSARQRLELEVEHPTAAPLPLLKLNGINDGKVYIPLAESRDWKQDVSTITCFEEPEEPAES